jgi:hypothetical protein
LIGYVSPASGRCKQYAREGAENFLGASAASLGFRSRSKSALLQRQRSPGATPQFTELGARSD